MSMQRERERVTKKEEKPAIGFFGLTTMQQKADADGVRGGKNKWI